MLSMYPAFFYKEKSGSYSVIFPDFPCGTCGDDLEDAMRMAVDFLAGQIIWMKEDGEPIPEPTPITEAKPDEDGDYESVFVTMVTVDAEDYARRHFSKSVKKTLTIPAWLNAAGMERNINFSQVLQEALRERIGA